MYFILRYFYPDLPVEPVSAEEFENEFLGDTEELGKIYFDWLVSFDTDFVDAGAGHCYRRKQRSMFVEKVMKSSLMQVKDLLFVMSLECDR